MVAWREGATIIACGASQGATREVRLPTAGPIDKECFLCLVCIQAHIIDIVALAVVGFCIG